MPAVVRLTERPQPCGVAAGGKEPTMSARSPLLITPECGSSGCSATGDQYTMVRCRACGHWYCAEHTALEVRVELTRSGDAQGASVAYYLGLCRACYDARAKVRH